MVLNTYTIFKFEFAGTKERFFQKITDWVTDTKEGRKYRIKDDHFTLQRKSIIIQFSLSEQSPSLLEVMVIGFVKGENPALLCCIPCTCWFREYPGFRSNKALDPPHKALLSTGRFGWDDMMNQLFSINVTSSYF